MASEADSLGYIVVDGPILSSELVKSAKAEVKNRVLELKNVTSDDHGYGLLGWGPRCAEVYESYRRILRHPFVASRIGDNPEPNVYMRGAICWIRNRKPLPKLRAGFDRIFLYIALADEIGPEDGLLKLVPGSHKQKSDVVEMQPEIDIRLSPGQALIMDGNMVIRYPQTGGGICIMAVYWKRKDIS